ncbi:hypothetical protein ACFYPC_10570 [Streptomyces sp. NPDC005808]
MVVFSSVSLCADQEFGCYAGWAGLFGKENGTGLVVDRDGAGG